MLTELAFQDSMGFYSSDFKFLVYAVLHVDRQGRQCAKSHKSLNIIQTVSKKKGLPEISDEA
jgi:hypothetical protein